MEVKSRIKPYLKYVFLPTKKAEVRLKLSDYTAKRWDHIVIFRVH